MKIVLFYPKLNKINETNDNDILDKMYSELAIIPSVDQLNEYSNIKNLLTINKIDTITNLIDTYKKYISRLSNKIPLFDYNTKNIYLITYEDVYQKVTQYNYRFPNKKIINLLKKTLDDLSNEKINKINWVQSYIKKINKNLNFLNNFNITILKQTYQEAFLDSNPTSKELTTCIRPSYLPYQKSYQTPYYTKSELISMGLNLNLIKNPTQQNPSNPTQPTSTENIPIKNYQIQIKTKPWSYSKSDLDVLCKQLSEYEINTQMLIYNQLYILYNNAKSYVQYYSLFGSYYINSYLRNPNSVFDSDMNEHINNFFKLMKSTPAFDNAYEVYRFIESDEYLSHLTIGDIFTEKSFISTTRNPFYSEKNNLFGFILLKIRLPKNTNGIALLMESYSNYPHEQEVLLMPGKLKLVEVNNDFSYYHWNKLAEKKIIKKYIFEYVEPLSYDINIHVKSYIKPTNNTHHMHHIPIIDFYSDNFINSIIGSNVQEKTLNFFNSLTKINLRRSFYSFIGQTKYQFFVYFLTQNKVYSKFFFLQKEDEQNKALGDEIYLSIQNPLNGQIELLIEIRNIISVNYYHRFSGLSSLIPEDQLLHWLAGLGKALNINNIIIHGNYSSYAHIVENILSSSNKTIIDKTITDKTITDKTNLLEEFEMIQNIDNPDANILNLYTADINTYCIDLIDYIFNGKKRFSQASQVYIEKKIPWHMLDNLKTIKFIDLYNSYGTQIEGNEQLYKIYKKQKSSITVNEFYQLIHLSYPYLITRLQNLITLSYPKNAPNPWHIYYVFKPYQYLYEKQIIKFIPEVDIEKVDQLIKNLAEEVKFIHENKFRQILL